MHGLKPMTHYHFREKIALAWLDEDQFWSTRYSRRPRSTPGTRRNTSSTKSLKSSSFSSARVTRSVATSSTISTSSAGKSCKTLNQSALSNGSFDKRLIISDEYTHLPAPATSKYSECQLHKWSEKRTRKQIAYCADCNICLCIKCYKTFHTVLDLQRVKNDIQNDCEYCVIASKAEKESPLSEMTPI